MNLGIVIVNYKTAADTIDCVRSLLAAKLPSALNLNIVVVDNASPDDSLPKLESSLPQVSLIKNPRNTGFTGGNNLGITAVLENGATHVLLLNNDTLVPANFFTKLLDSRITDDSVGIVSPKIYFAPGFEFHHNRYRDSDRGRVIWYAGGVLDWKNVLGSHRGVDEVDNGQYDQSVATDFATGCCLLVKRAVLEQIGLLNDNYFLYLEDVEFCHRARLSGWGIEYDPSFFLWHKVAKSTGGSGSGINDYFITRNRLLFGLKYAAIRTRLALLRLSLKLLLTGTSAQKTAVRDLYAGRLGKGSFLS